MTSKTNTSKRNASKRATAGSHASAVRSTHKRAASPKAGPRTTRARVAKPKSTAPKAHAPRPASQAQGERNRTQNDAVWVLVAPPPAHADRLPALRRVTQYLGRTGGKLAAGWRGALPEVLSNRWTAMASKGRTLLLTLKQRLVSARAS